MENKVYYLLLLLLYITFVICGICYYSSTYRYKCGRRISRRRCTGTTTHSKCCDGYSDYTSDCRYPLCNGKPTPLGGCSEVNPTDTIKYRGGGSRNQGEGTCISPGLCADCKDGFYADWALCKRLFVKETLNI